MSQSYFFVPGAAGGNNVLVQNSHAAGQDVPVHVYNDASQPGLQSIVGPGGQQAMQTNWNGSLFAPLSALDVQSAGAITNSGVEAISVGAGDSTLNRPALCSNFLSVVVYNPTLTDCTFTIGNANPSTFTVQANSSVQFDCNCTKLVLHATDVGQHIVGLVYNPATT